MSGQEDQEPAQQADEIVVIEISGLVDQLDVREADEEQRCTHPELPAERDREGEKRKRQEQQVHEHGWQRPDPWKQLPREVKCRDDVELVHPIERHEADHARGHQEAEQNPERCE